MLTLLALGAVALLVFGTVAIPFIVIALAFKIVFGILGLVFGLFFGLLGGVLRLVFGLVGAVLGLIFAPAVLLLLAIVAIGGLIAGLASLIVPLIPFVLLGGLIWAVFRMRQPVAGSL